MDILFITSATALASAAATALACGIKCGGKIARRDVRIVELESRVGELEGDIIRQCGTILSRDRDIERLKGQSRNAWSAFAEMKGERDAAIARTISAKAKSQPRISGRFAKAA